MLYPVLNHRSPLSLKTKINIYLLYIRPVITYASEAWGSQISTSSWSKLERIQTTCLRIITASPKVVSNHTILQSAHLPTIKQYVTNVTKNLFHKNSTSTFNHIFNIGQEYTEPHHTLINKKLRPLDWVKQL